MLAILVIRRALDLTFRLSNRYFGTATKVKKKGRSKGGHPDTYSIDIQFDDKSTDTIEYPTTDTQILTIEGDEAYVEMEDGNRAVAYEGTLEDLAVGDLVEGRYQAGAENGAWFRGRVASINSATGTCDILYYDKEVRFLFCLLSITASLNLFSNTTILLLTSPTTTVRAQYSNHANKLV